MISVIFDMDDMLVATAALWRRAEEQFLREIGAAWSEDLARQYKGMNALDVAATAHRTLQPKASLEECQHRMRSALLQEFAGELPGEMPGAVNCVRLMAQHTKIAVASGSPLEAIESVMTQLGLLQKFSVVLSSESVNRGKPHPDVFLAAAERLGAKPSDCVVFEDSIVGVQAAVAAKMRCMAVPSSVGARDEIRKLGANVVHSLEQVSWEGVVRAVGGGKITG